MSLRTLNNSDVGEFLPPDDENLLGGNEWDKLISGINLGEAYRYLLTRSGSTYYVKASAGEIIHQGANGKIEAQWAIDNLPSDGGSIILAPNITLDLGSAAGDGLTIPENRPKRINFLGSGNTSAILYSGVGQAIRIVNDVDLSSHVNYEIGNFMLSAVPSPFTSGTNTITSGCNGIKIDHTYGIFDLHHIFFRNFDIGIWTDSTEFSSIHHIVGKDFNHGIYVTGDAGHNTLSGLHITDFSLSGGHTKGIYYNASQFNAESLYIARGVTSVIPVCIQVDGFVSNIKIEDIYFEGTLPAAEATYGGETQSFVYLKGEAAKPIDQAILSNLRMGGVENMDNAIKIEYARNIIIDTPVAKGLRNALLLINSNTATDTSVIIRNPRLRAFPNLTNTVTPWLIDVPSNAFLTTAEAKLCGSVEESGRTGIIVNISSTGLVEGDIVILTGADATLATTTTAEAANPSAIMYPNAGANRPGVIAVSGKTKILTDAATTLGDTLTTSATVKKAKINNSVIDPRLIIGTAAASIGSAGLCMARIR